MAKKDFSYNDAIAEIQQILLEIESESIDINLLSIKIKRATELLKFCKNKLKKTDEEVETLLKEMTE